MSKTLVTIPNGPALPTDVSGLPEGYPFRLNTTGALYSLKAGVFALLGGGGGGGSIVYHELMPATGVTDFKAVPGADTNGIAQFTNDRVVYPNTTPAAVPNQNERDAAGADITQAFLMQATRPNQSNDYLGQIVWNNNSGAPNYPNDPLNLDPGFGRAVRVDFRYKGMDNGRGCFVAAYTDAYDPADVSRVIPVWSEVDAKEHHTATGRFKDQAYFGEMNQDNDRYGFEWAHNADFGSAWKDFSVTLPAGSSRLTFAAWTTGTFAGTGDSSNKTTAFRPAITDVRVTFLDVVDSSGAPIKDGTVAVETSTQAVWLFDSSLKYRAYTDSQTAPPRSLEAGSGWYRIVKGRMQVSPNGGFQLDPAGAAYNGMVHLGPHHFSEATDLGGNAFGLRAFSKVPYDLTLTLPVGAAITSSFEERFLTTDGDLPAIFGVLNQSATTVPTIFSVAGQYDVAPGQAAAPGRVPAAATRYFRVTRMQLRDFGSYYESLPSAEVAYTNSTTFPQKAVITVDNANEDAKYNLYESATPGGPYNKIGTYAKHPGFGDLQAGGSLFVMEWTYTSPSGVATALPTVDATHNTYISRAALQFFPGAGSPEVVMDSGSANFEYIFEGKIACGNSGATFNFRRDDITSTGAALGTLQFTLVNAANAGNSFNWSLNNVVAGASTVIASGALNVPGGNGDITRVHLRGVGSQVDIDVDAVDAIRRPISFPAVYSGVITAHAAATGYGVRMDNLAAALDFGFLTRWFSKYYPAGNGPSNGYYFPMEALQGAKNRIPVEFTSGHGRIVEFYISAERTQTLELVVIHRPTGSSDLTNKRQVFRKVGGLLLVYSNSGQLGGTVSDNLNEDDYYLAPGDQFEVYLKIPAGYGETQPNKINARIYYGGK